MSGPHEISVAEPTVAQTPELIQRWRRFKAEHRQEDRDALILHYCPLVQRVAGVIKQNLPRGIDADDLSGWGVFGLIEAIESYEPDRGIAFSSFARFRIRGAIMDELRRQDWLPRSVRATQKRENHAPLADPDQVRVDDPKRLKHYMQAAEHIASAAALVRSVRAS